ncbi:MAG: hypothetical protein HKO02_01505 [Hyphomonadaceae bacterium]|nr:hypothetical protein [Hyphomonadaceae bacterium]
MRLAFCTLSAVLLSGCSWLGIGGNSSSSYGQYGAGGGAYGCAPGTYGGGQYAYGSQYSYMGQGGAGCAGAGSYGMSGSGYGAGSGAYGAGASQYAMNGYAAGPGAYGAGAYGAGTGAHGTGVEAHGLRGAQSSSSYGHGYGAGGGASYGAGTGTALGAGTPFGTAVGGQYVNGQWVSTGVSGSSGTSTYQTIQGAPIYVPQPYPAYYGVASGGGYNYGYGYGGGLRGGGAALPFGFEAGVGTDFSVDGDIFPGELAKPFLGGPGTVSDLPAVSYKDAYKEAAHYDLAATYDIDPSTTLIGRIGYSKAEGERLLVGQVDDGAGLTEDLYAEFSDLEQVTLEGGVRKYMGSWNNRFAGVRPYVGATAGFTHNAAVDLTQSSATLVDPALFTQEYIDAGWTPTASGVVGAEMQVGPRTAIGVETGVRWSDDLDTNFETGDRISIPVRLRGRVSF